MKHLYLICTFLLLFIFSTTSAQNTAPCESIVLKNGDTIQVNIINLDKQEVRYHPCDDETVTKLFRTTRIKAVYDAQGKLLAEGREEITVEPKPKEVKKVRISPSIARLFDDHLDTNQKWFIKSRDKKKYNGIILEKDSNRLRITDKKLGIISIERSNIRFAHEWKYNRLAPQYLQAVSAFHPRKGESYFQNTNLFQNELSYGINNNFSIQLHSTLVADFEFSYTVIPIIIPRTYLLYLAISNEIPIDIDRSIPIWISPKFSKSIADDKAKLALVADIGVNFELDRPTQEKTHHFQILHGIATIGSTDQNLSLGLRGGYFKDGNWQNDPVISLAGLYRTSHSHYLIFESYLVTKQLNTSTFYLGGRILDQGININYGLNLMPTTGIYSAYKNDTYENDFTILPRVRITFIIGD